MDLIIHTEHLAGGDLRMARYLAALSDYRRVSDEFAAALREHGQADATAVDAASKRLAEIENDEAFVRDLMVSVSEAAAQTGLAVPTIRRLANGNHPLSDQVRSEQRHGKLWYVVPEDIHFLIETDEITPRDR